MGIFGFGEKISPTRILVCSIGDENILKSLADADAEVYIKYYRYVVKKIALDGKSLMTLIKTGDYDIIHILARVDILGKIDGIHVNDIHHICGENNIKIVFWAADNNENAYINYFKPSYFNLVFTLNRRGQYFDNFLDDLLSRMSEGKTMPKAWVELVPQRETAPEHESAPSCVLNAQRPRVRFLP